MTATSISYKDGSGNSQTVMVQQTSAGNAPSYSLVDPTSGNAALVTQFHNSDGQSLGTVYGVMTGGVDQLINPSGTLDRKRGGYITNQTSATGFANEIAMGVYNTALPTVASGSIVPQQMDASGRLIISPNTTVGGSNRFGTAALTRPANTTAYTGTATSPVFMNTSVTAGSGSPLYLNVARVNGGSGQIITARMFVYSNQTTKGDFTLWLFNTALTGASGYVDAASAAFTNGDMAYCVGFINFPSSAGRVSNPGSGAAGSTIYLTNIVLPFQAPSGQLWLQGILTCNNAYTPTSGESYNIQLGVSQD